MRRAFIDKAGVVAIEFAILAPVLFMLLIGTVEVGRMLWTRNALQYAVAAAARCVSIDWNVCSSIQKTRDFAATASGLAFPNTIFLVGTARCGNLISARYTFNFVGGILPLSVSMTAQSCFPV